MHVTESQKSVSYKIYQDVDWNSRMQKWAAVKTDKMSPHNATPRHHYLCLFFYLCWVFYATSVSGKIFKHF